MQSLLSNIIDVVETIITIEEADELVQILASACAALQEKRKTLINKRKDKTRSTLSKKVQAKISTYNKNRDDLHPIDETYLRCISFAISRKQNGNICASRVRYGIDFDLDVEGVQKRFIEPVLGSRDYYQSNADISCINKMFIDEYQGYCLFEIALASKQQQLVNALITEFKSPGFSWFWTGNQKPIEEWLALYGEEE